MKKVTSVSSAATSPFCRQHSPEVLNEYLELGNSPNLEFVQLEITYGY
jgi:hypothetical protein